MRWLVIGDIFQSTRHFCFRMEWSFHIRSQSRPRMLGLNYPEKCHRNHRTTFAVPNRECLMSIGQTEIGNALLGTGLCVVLALGLTFSFRHSSLKSILPFLFLVVIVAVTMRFGTFAGRLGTGKFRNYGGCIGITHGTSLTLTM